MPWRLIGREDVRCSAVELANRESRSSWKEFLLGLKGRGLHGVEFVVSDDHPGLKKAIAEVLPEAAWQRCYVHFLGMRSTMFRAKSTMTVCRSCAGSMTDAISPRPGAISLQWLAKWQGKYAKLCAWVEDNIEETLTYYRLPLAAPQAHEEHQHAGAAQPGDQAAYPRRSHLPQCRELPALGPGA